MIQANDLRKNSLVLIDGEIEEIGWNSLGFEEVPATPIAITPEILKKCGFTKVGVGDLYSLRISINSTDELAWYSQDDTLRYQTKGSGFTRDYGVKYLHQLQNLYYSLTQTELPITL